jgi:hypothetical protein
MRYIPWDEGGGVSRDKRDTSGDTCETERRTERMALRTE